MKHEYRLVCEWTDEFGCGTTAYDAYSRNHSVSFESGQRFECSADKAFRGDPRRANPEELLLASISSCHMLWFLHLACDAGIVVTRYRDNAVAELDMKAEPQRVVSALLSPEIESTKAVSPETLRRLHDDAHARCFIANSVNFPITVDAPTPETHQGPASEPRGLG